MTRQEGKWHRMKWEWKGQGRRGEERRREEYLSRIDIARIDRIYSMEGKERILKFKYRLERSVMRRKVSRE